MLHNRLKFIKIGSQRLLGDKRLFLSLVIHVELDFTRGNIIFAWTVFGLRSEHREISWNAYKSLRGNNCVLEI